MINIAQPAVGEEEIEAVAEVMRSGMLAQGSVTTEFENNFAEYCGVSHAVGVNSGTAALHMGLLALGIGAGDEVIVPSFTFIATATAVSMCGATPVIVDVTEDTYTINPEEITANITDRTKAVIGVHLFGQPFDVDSVLKICDEHNLYLIEDAAQAHGAVYKGKRAGGFGKIGCFSFYPTKNMTTGEGGIVTTNDQDIDQKIRRLINHGQSEKYLHTELGYNMRLSNISAAIGNVQLRKIDGMNRKRAANAEVYNKNISAEGIKTPFCMSDSEHVWHQYVIEVKDNFPMSRDEFMVYLREKGIGSAVHYPIPVHMQPMYSDSGSINRKISESGCPVSERLASEVLSLPVHPGVSPEECEYICDIINEVN
ncbi:DegT/DnrJ/EryC1/StrS family aminotransferase [Methanoplanus limicola]|uniref:DegT/DnrJ/EryC1/StrS aminotransferase n=1 Tax=Methanoplanus limicola DSM 2279 TaxID=937775 RepID=H1Z0B2_9EURY|nr:DegT/DnrJ/EryC1/StrS family aminotransferase [Methanoplanus limicola]EHQ34379.1 DegT/DnrJ/EryC1/StrS aminotransferase [Methanoplanus limicola DSM 2279]